MAGPGRASSRCAEPHTATQRHWCGGRRRGWRARAGFEIDHSEPQARVWRSRGRPGPTAPGTPAAPQATSSIANSGCGGRGRRRGQAGQRDDAPRRRRCGGHRRDRRVQEGLAAVPVGGGRASPSDTSAAGVEGAGGTGGHGRGAGGWRQGQGGPRDRPLRAAGSRVAISRAAGPDGARNTSGAASTAGNQAISGSRAPSGSPTRRQHPSARAGAPNRR